ncbi:DUF6020 family protein [Bifidobacterium platyrrhinorum]|uniref:DUF6020 family protein n=1 Tax=Bifidobacterium platyrrhinorum TaxID=2661628 RepID=UPI0013CF84AB|nr:DUF6020 family protein [Bifidobacterium platyrrhinorum]
MSYGRIWPARFVPCAAGALVIALADQAAVRASFGPFDARFWLKAAVLAVALSVLFVAGERLLTAVPRTGRGSIAHRAASMRILAPVRVAAAWFEGLRAVPRLAVSAMLILLCWAPVIVMMFPGAIWYDTGDQIAQFLAVAGQGGAAAAVSAHHPVFDTIVFGSSAWLGEAAAGDWRVGIGAYLAVQVAVTCTELAGMCLYARHIGCGRAPAAGMLLFFAVFPAFPIFTMSVVKDTLHMMFLIPWLLMVVETVRTRLDALSSPRFLAGFLAVSTLCALTTMTGLYIVALTLFCLVPLHAPARRRLAALGCAMAVALVAGVVFPAAVRGPLRVRGEDANQLLVVPMQMTARYALDHPGDVTTRERAAIDRVNRVPFERMARRYNPYLADPVIQYSLRDPSAVPEYLEAWLAMGVRHPDSYLIAFAALESGWCSLERTPLDTTSRGIPLETLDRHAADATANTMWFQINDAVSPSFRPLAGKTPAKAGRAAAYRLWDAWRGTTVPNPAALTATWTFILPLFLLFHGFGCAGRRPRWVPFAIPLVWSLLALLPNAISLPLKPTATRYMMWAPVMVPLMLALLRADAVAPSRLWGIRGRRA